MSYFFLIVYSILALLFMRPKIVVTQRGYVLNCFRFKHATVYKQLLANVLLQNIVTYGLQIKNYTILTKTVGTVEVKYCSTERKNFKAVFIARAED